MFKFTLLKYLFMFAAFYAGEDGGGDGGDGGDGGQEGDEGGDKGAAGLGGGGTEEPGGQEGGDGGDGGDKGQQGDFKGPEWAKGLEGLDEDILSDPSLQAIKDLSSLTKSYVHAQRKIGEKGVQIPSENASQEEWDTFYQKTGVPLEADKYKKSLELKPGEDAQFDETFNDEFMKKAHELRVHPKQAKEMYQFFNDQAKNSTESFMTQESEKQQQQLDALRDEWGEQAYDQKVKRAEKFLGEAVGKDFLKYLGETGLGKNAEMVKAFAKMADTYFSEEKLPGGDPKTALTKDQAQQEINTIMSNFDDPYHKPNHADHKRRVDEVQKLFQIVG